jgi:hypothetical protein
VLSEVPFLISSFRTSAFPPRERVRQLTISPHSNFSVEPYFEAVGILFCSDLHFCSPPWLLALDVRTSASGDFYFRAEHESLPFRASGMLTARMRNWRCEDFHSTRSSALLAAPPKSGCRPWHFVMQPSCRVHRLKCLSTYTRSSLSLLHTSINFVLHLPEAQRLPNTTSINPPCAESPFAFPRCYLFQE